MAAIKATNAYKSTMKKYNVSMSSTVMYRNNQEEANQIIDFDVDEASEALSFEKIASKLTFIPKNNRLYSLWNFMISMISLVQTIMYAVFVGWGFHHDAFDWQNILLAILELLYLVNIIIQFFIAYDE